jgi:hypothetical protein
MAFWFLVIRYMYENGNVIMMIMPITRDVAAGRTSISRVPWKFIHSSSRSH